MVPAPRDFRASVWGVVPGVGTPPPGRVTVNSFEMRPRGGFVLRLEKTSRGQTEKPLDVYFIDVEGGQATLLVTPSGESMLIDTGYPGLGAIATSIACSATIKQAGLTQLDYLLVTHYHDDHVGNAAAIAAHIPVGTFVDHGESVETDDNARALYAGYVKARATGRHLLVKPGNKIPIRDLDVTIVTAGGEHLTRPLSAPAGPNPLCAAFKAKDADPSENARSVGSMIAFGRFR